MSLSDAAPREEPGPLPYRKATACCTCISRRTAAPAAETGSARPDKPCSAAALKPVAGLGLASSRRRPCTHATLASVAGMLAAGAISARAGSCRAVSATRLRLAAGAVAAAPASPAGGGALAPDLAAGCSARGAASGAPDWAAAGAIVGASAGLASPSTAAPCSQICVVGEATCNQHFPSSMVSCEMSPIPSYSKISESSSVKLQHSRCKRQITPAGLPRHLQAAVQRATSRRLVLLLWTA